MPLRDVLAMPTPEFHAWMNFYAVEPWGMADAALAAWGTKKEAPTMSASWEAMQAHISGALGVTHGSPEGT